MSPTFLKVLNFLPLGSGNPSSQRSKNSIQPSRTQSFTRHVEAGLAVRQQEHHPDTKDTTSTQPNLGSRRLSVSSLKRRLRRSTSISSIRSCPPPSTTSTQQNEHSVASTPPTPCYQTEAHLNKRDDENAAVSAINTFESIAPQTTETSDAMAENFTTGCATSVPQKTSTADATQSVAKWIPASSKSFSSALSFESFSSTISPISSCPTSPAYSCSEDCSDNMRLRSDEDHEIEHDRRETIVESLESTTLPDAVCCTKVVAEVGKNKDIHAHADTSMKTTARPLRVPCQTVNDEKRACDQFHCRHFHHADGQVQQNKQTTQPQHQHQGGNDTRQHEGEAHGITLSNSGRYIFDSPLSVSPPPLLPLLSSCMPPQEYTPQPGIDDGMPRQIHGANVVVIQDPLKRFEILERLGYGSSGSSVFKALDKADNLKPLAIKKIPLSSLSDGLGGSDLNRQVDVDYFISCITDHSRRSRQHVDDYNINESYEETQRESTSKSTVGLDKVVQCLGIYQTDTELWLSLEYCGGGSVEDLIRLSDGPLTESEIGWIMSQVLLGVAFLHNKDHVHGDIKASNILLTTDGNIKLGGSGSIMDHKKGAGERKRRRRSLAMTEFPTSWLAPESNPSSSKLPGAEGTNSDKPHNDASSTKRGQWMPNASAATDVWALGIACIELSQGRAPGPDMPILALFGEKQIVDSQSTAFGRRSDGSLVMNMGWGSIQQTGTFGAARMGMSEEMWSFIARCLTREPESRPSVQELLEDPFIKRYSEPSTEFLERIQRMMEFVDQCAFISSDTLCDTPSSSLLPSSSSSTLSSSTSSLTLSPSKSSYMADMKLEEANIAPWVIPMVRPRVDSAYDASSFFDDAGMPTSPPEPGTSSNVSGWKHQRVSHPVVKQALLREQAGYVIFRHSRSPSLATIVECQLEEDKEIGPGQVDDHMIGYGGFCGSSLGNTQSCNVTC